MSLRASSGSFVVLAALSLVTSPALAQGTSDSLAAALKQFDAGRKAFDAGQFEEALASFQQSYSLSASPNSRLYAGRCLRALGKTASAYTTFRLASREAQDRLSSTGEKRYAATRDAASSEAAELEPKVPRMTLAVPAGTPDGFSLKVNGAEIPRGAWGIAVETDPGNVVVEAAGPRLTPFHQEFKLAEAEQKRVEVKADRLPTSSISMRFRSRPGGMAVEADGNAIDAAKADALAEVDPGAHRVVVTAPGYKPFIWTKSLDNGERATIDIALVQEPRASGPSGTPKWLFFAIGAGAVGALVPATIIAASAKSSADDELAKTPYERSSDTRDSVRSRATTANVLFIGGGILAAGAVILGFTTHWRNPESRAVAALLGQKVVF